MNAMPRDDVHADAAAHERGDDRGGSARGRTQRGSSGHGRVVGAQEVRRGDEAVRPAWITLLIRALLGASDPGCRVASKARITRSASGEFVGSPDDTPQQVEAVAAGARAPIVRRHERSPHRRARNRSMSISWVGMSRPVKGSSRSAGGPDRGGPGDEGRAGAARQLTDGRFAGRACRRGQGLLDGAECGVERAQPAAR